MNHRYLLFVLGGIFLQSSIAMAQLPSIDSVLAPVENAEQYHKYEWEVELSASYVNPYDYGEIHLWGNFVSPSGDTMKVDGFFMEAYTGPNSNGQVTLPGTGSFRIRFAPTEVGQWSYQLFVRDANGETSAPSATFECGVSSNEVNKGFVRLSETNYLRFDDGEMFLPIGQNIGWANGNPYRDYQRWLDSLHQRGANFFRIWNCDWGLSLEWHGGKYGGLGQYQQENAAYLDWLFDYAANQGQYAMLCLQHHGQVSTTVNPEWDRSPYNQVNGGMCNQTWEFFTDPQARAYTQNRLRYTVARYGYARSIAAWELFNEVDWTDNYEQHKSKVADWHEEMAAFLKEIDPYEHLVTTSFARDQYEPIVWTLDDIDFTQTHYYAAIPNLERTLARGVQDYLTAYDKPTLTGEFGIRTNGGSLSTEDPDGIHLHNSIWGSFFAGGMGSGMSWWWDSYINPRRLYYHYEPLVELTHGLPLLEKDFQPHQVRIEGAGGDLVLSPTQGWGTLGDEQIAINPDGSTDPGSPNLGEYLYGAQWNTQFRSPPTFSVEYPTAGTFTVRTGADAGQDPRIVITVNGNVELDQAASTATDYSVSLPAGVHQIKVDNQGTDWITISGYTFEGLGSALDVYALKARDSSVLAAWVLNHEYNHVTLQDGIPDAITGGELLLEGMAPGTYFAKWYDCLSGQIVTATEVNVQQDSLWISVPAVTWDLALVLDDEAATVGVEQMLAMELNLYPNPAQGGILNLDFELKEVGEVRIRLMDLAGREVAILDKGERRAGNQQWKGELPSSLVPGTYWLQVLTSNQVGSVPLLWLGQ